MFSFISIRKKTTGNKGLVAVEVVGGHYFRGVAGSRKVRLEG